MTTLPFPNPATRVTPLPRRWSAAPVLTIMLLVAGIVARAVGRVVPRRRATAGRRRLDAGERLPTISEVLTRIPDESARIVLQTIALQAQSLTGSELAAAGVGGDATRPFTIWAHVGMPPEQVEQIG